MKQAETVRVPSEWTYEDIRVQTYTGRFIPDYGLQDKRAGRYRSGMLTKIGDIEEHEWIVYAEELVRRNGDEALFKQLKSWYRDTAHWFESEMDLKRYTLVCLIDGIPNDPQWVDYIAFNAKYRPERLQQKTTGERHNGNEQI